MTQEESTRALIPIVEEVKKVIRACPSAKWFFVVTTDGDYSVEYVGAHDGEGAPDYWLKQVAENLLQRLREGRGGKEKP